MKSFCIKSNNPHIIDYLLNEFSEINLETIYLSTSSFKIYENIIVHYIGDDIPAFCNSFCDILTTCITSFYEKKILRNIINYNYFYFNDIEKQKILESCLNLFNDEDTSKEKYNSIYNAIYSYILEHHSIVLNGFVNFRLYEYHNILDYATSLSVSNFLIEREYYEFIDLLQLYITSKQSKTDVVHLVYTNKESILLDEKKDIIPIDYELLDAKYLSDISFSTNDYCLNTLLNLLPNKLYIHLITGAEDEFITTLKLIFDTRVTICTDCDICRVYRLTSVK
jgi:putative sporulation protein YtxC